MANHYLHIGPITGAMRGKRLLEARGMRAFLQKTSSPPAPEGCGYSLLVIGDVGQASAILQKGGIPVRRISEGL